MKKHDWTQKDDEDSVEITIGDETLVIGGMSKLNEMERERRIHTVLNHHLKNKVTKGLVNSVLLVTASASPPKKAVMPPALAETILQLFSPKSSSEQTLGDYQEMLETETVSLGEKHAKRRYWQRVIRNVGPSIWQRFLGLSFISAFIAYLRAKIGV